jgi:hypothetical protein
MEPRTGQTADKIGELPARYPPMTKQTKIDRKTIDEPWLAECLGLNEDWIDHCERVRKVAGASLPDKLAVEPGSEEVGACRPSGQATEEQDNEWVEESSVPDALPAFIRKGRTGSEIADAEAATDRLVAAGCSRRVVYFCLEQLSPNAKEIRFGREWKAAVPSKDGGDDSLIKRPKKLATSEDLESVVNAAKNARKQIHLHRQELLIVADTKVYPVPKGVMMTQLELAEDTHAPIAEDALDLLADYLTWVMKLAEAYTVPMRTTLLKSKGLLYLTIYVSLYADPKKIRSSKVSQVLKDASTASRDTRAKREITAPGNALAGAVLACTGEERSPSDLYEKVKGFKTEHPRLYDKLKSKLIELHQFASR